MSEIDQARIALREAMARLWRMLDENVSGIEDRDDRVEEVFDNIVDSEMSTVKAGLHE